MKLFISFLIIVITSGCASGEAANVKCTVRVLDVETGMPVTNAVVQNYLTEQYSPWEKKKNIVKRQEVPVDENGEAVIEGKDIYGGAGGTAYAEGYYTGSAGIKSEGRNLVLNRWEPWNPMIEVKIRPKKNPVPMVFDGIKDEDIPAWDEPIGFDFETGDWTAPHGKGQQKDMLFLVTKKSYQGAECHISFPNELDGIQTYLPSENLQSEYIFPYLAPTNGYTPKLFKEKWYASVAADPETNIKGYNEINYIFRVRTKVDEKGNIISANYGRIRGDIKTSSKGRIYFKYWFNPDPQSRSLESDKKPY